MPAYVVWLSHICRAALCCINCHAHPPRPYPTLLPHSPSPSPSAPCLVTYSLCAKCQVFYALRRIQHNEANSAASGKLQAARGRQQVASFKHALSCNVNCDVDCDGDGDCDWSHMQIEHAVIMRIKRATACATRRRHPPRCPCNSTPA